MKLEARQKEAYSKERFSALEALRLANEIAFAPVVFQISRLMVKFGIFKLLSDNDQGLTEEAIAKATGLSEYAVKVLLESSLTIGTIYVDGDNFKLGKAGFFLISDEMTKVNMDFIADVNYQGLFNLEESLKEGRPAGLKVFGSWPTVYEGLSSLPKNVQDSWFAFDHFYSDLSFDKALEIVFKNKPKKLLDVGGNTGKWAMKCVGYSKDVNVTIMDLPQQIGLMRKATAGLDGADRIFDYPANLLDDSVAFPTGFDAIWMSQFLDCFSEQQVVSILSRAAASMSPDTKLYIMETLWDKHPHEMGSYCLTQISVYFTAIANGNSKMFYSGDLKKCIEKAGMKVTQMIDGLGKGHSIIVCSKS